MIKKFKIKRGDKIKVISGKDKGKTGTIIKLLPAKNKVIVSGVNIALKHLKASKTSEGGIVKKELPIHVSNVAYIDPTKNVHTKIGFKYLENGIKARYCKKSGEIITEVK